MELNGQLLTFAGARPEAHDVVNVENALMHAYLSAYRPVRVVALLFLRACRIPGAYPAYLVIGYVAWLIAVIEHLGVEEQAFRRDVPIAVYVSGIPQRQNGCL